MKTNHLFNTTQLAATHHAGRCIYCSHVNTTDLTREHVIPRALGGGLILHDASCSYHQKIINEEVETPILSHFLGPFRQAHGMRKSPPSTRKIPVDVENSDGTTKPVLISIDDYPELLAMPYTERMPGLLTGESACAATWEKTAFVHNPESISRLEKKLNGRVHLRGSVPNNAFVRFLAKVAHGNTIPHFDFKFNPLLLDLIDGKGLETAGLLVGIDHDPPAPIGKGQSHTLRCRVGRTKAEWLIIVSVRLFASLGAPSYAVIAGTFPDGAHPDWEGGEPLPQLQHK